MSADTDNSLTKSRAYKGKCLTEFPSSYIVLDLETTGLSPSSDFIIEVGAIKIQNDSIVEKFEQLINPGFPIPHFITGLTGINDGMVENSPRFFEVLNSLTDFLGEDIIVGHNVNFDVNFLYDNFERHGKYFSNDFVDTMRISRQLFSHFPSHKLGDVVRALEIKLDYTAHRALGDVYATNAIYQKMKGIALN